MLPTRFFGTKNTVDPLGIPQKLQSQIQMKYYDSGHMMYLRREDLAKLKGNVAGFITAHVARRIWTPSYLWLFLGTFHEFAVEEC